MRREGEATEAGRGGGPRGVGDLLDAERLGLGGLAHDALELLLLALDLLLLDLDRLLALRDLHLQLLLPARSSRRASFQCSITLKMMI